MKVDTKVLARYLLDRPTPPAGKIEDVELAVTTIPKGKEMTVISMRNALFMGQVPTSVRFDIDLQVRELSYDGGVWMRDDPQEVWQMHEPVTKAKGRVLVGGLGLGVLSHLLCLQRAVDCVATVEADQRVSDLVSSSVHWKNETIIKDLFKFCKECSAEDFDSAVFDIWQPTGEFVWQKYVVPLRRLMRGKMLQQNIHCWNEKEMVGQIVQALPRVVLCDVQYSGCQGYYEVFQSVATQKLGPFKKYKLREDTMQMWGQAEELRNNPKMQDLIKLYTTQVGTVKWEKTFGDLWDKRVTPYLAKQEAET